jgi:hypothetical protein
MSSSRKIKCQLDYSKAIAILKVKNKYLSHNTDYLPFAITEMLFQVEFKRSDPQ